MVRKGIEIRLRILLLLDEEQSNSLTGARILGFIKERLLIGAGLSGRIKRSCTGTK